MRHLWRDERMRQVLAACVTLGFATGVSAVSFGVSAVAAGASVWQTCAMSLLVFTGASQFSAVSVIGGGGTPVAAFSGAAVLAAYLEEARLWKARMLLNQNWGCAVTSFQIAMGARAKA